jgi:hypothetical protein
MYVRFGVRCAETRFQSRRAKSSSVERCQSETDTLQP